MLLYEEMKEHSILRTKGQKAERAGGSHMMMNLMCSVVRVGILTLHHEGCWKDLKQEGDMISLI